MHALKTWLKRKHGLLGAGLLSTLLACPLTWAQPPVGDQPMFDDPLASGTAAQEKRPDIVITLGETITLSHASRKNIKQIEVSKGGVIGDIRPIEPNNPSIYTAKGMGVGVVDITLIDETGIADAKRIRVDPDISYIKSLVAKTFPTANVNIVPGSSQNTFIVTGWVESVEDVEPLQRFMLGFVQASGGRVNQNAVTMAVKVAGVQQVMLEVCLARVNRSEARNMGFSFQYGGNENIFGSVLPPATGATQGSFSPLGGILDNVLAGASTPGTPGTNLNLGVVGTNTAFLGLLQALRQEGVAKILANPSLTTISGRPADFLVGGETPAVVAGGAGGGGGAAGGGGAIQFRQFGTRVSFLPVVLGEGKIRVQVQAEVSRNAGTISNLNYTAPSFEVNSVQSTVELENGQTLIIGGLLQNEVNSTATKVPVLGDMPFLGMAFRSVEYREQETELVVAVTVSLVDALDKSQRPKMLPGQETRSPTDFELFVEGILEAPRGCRDPFPCKTYVPAHKLADQFGCPMGHCDNSKLWHKDGGLCGSCGTQCGTGCNTGCATGCATGCGTATVNGSAPAAPLAPAPVQTAPAPAPAPASKDGMKPTTMAVPAEQPVVIVPAAAPAASQGHVMPAAPQMPKAEAPAIPPLPEASKVVPPLPERQ